MVEKRETFGSRLAVIFAMAGSAIGLGNIWRFPYMAGEHGGAAFVMVYILATVLISLPVFIAEVTIGRRSRTSSYGAMSKLSSGKRLWKAAGKLSIFIPVVIASYYSVIGGWSLEFLVKSCTFAFVRNSPQEVSSVFTEFISSPWGPLVAHLVFLSICAFIVALGVRAGIEKFSKVTIPVLFVLIVLMAVYSISLPGAASGVKYLFKPDFSQLSPKTFAYAMGQSFYSLSLGMGAIITYGSYVHKEENLVVSGAGAALSDLGFALLAGLAIMPAVFAAGIEPGAGPGLIFQSIPFIFSSMGAELPVLSSIIAIVFFLTIVVAALTSNISLFEVGVSFFRDRFNVPRVKASILLFVICGALGILCSLSFGPLSFIKIVDKNIFDLFDWFCSNVLLLIMAELTVIFVGFVLKKEAVWDEVTNAGTKPFNVKIFNVLYFLMKWVAPVAIALIFITNFIL